MPRKIRICQPGLTYHVMSRCIEKKSLMKPSKMKDMMITVMQLAQDKYIFELVAYTVMDNHFHFCIRTCADGENISKIMQFIKSQYARRYNKIMNRTGPFWNERFKDTIIENSDAPREVFNKVNLYLGYNPVRSGYVKDPRSYKYSSFNCYWDENYKPPVKITLHPYFLCMGSTFQDCARKFLEYEEEFRKNITLLL